MEEVIGSDYKKPGWGCRGRWVGGWVGAGVRSLPVATVQLLVAMDKLTGR